MLASETLWSWGMDPEDHEMVRDPDAWWQTVKICLLNAEEDYVLRRKREQRGRNPRETSWRPMNPSCPISVPTISKSSGFTLACTVIISRPVTLSPTSQSTYAWNLIIYLFSYLHNYIDALSMISYCLKMPMMMMKSFFKNHSLR